MCFLSPRFLATRAPSFPLAPFSTDRVGMVRAGLVIDASAPETLRRRWPNRRCARLPLSHPHGARTPAKVAGERGKAPDGRAWDILGQKRGRSRVEAGIAGIPRLAKSATFSSRLSIS